ncbi:hypothetical protein M9H77_17313 [Catharanthus roseus]|uniref:Uncharacterized protein n=1 Tax=Catharanthus roseus TaxID=4058 RepID=A0ACC0B468_CATRO|nr:hypothetical protein M9H77_17313 [Catharanthus roseus]
MGAKSKQENYQSKLTRDMHNFYHASGYGFNAYGGKNHDYGNFTPKRHNGVGKFSFYAKSFEHTSYDDYGGYDRDNGKYDYYDHSPYDCFAKYHHSCVNEIPQATIEVEETIVLHVKEEITNVENYSLKRDKNIEKESIKIKEKEIVEENEILVKRLCMFDSISIFSKESEHLECSKAKESELEKKKKQFIEFNSLSCIIPRVDEYHDNVTNYASCVLGIEDKEWIMEKELGTILEDLSKSLSLNPCFSFS